MKKVTLLLLTLAFIVVNVQAQDDELVSKKGYKILPESGDIAIGVDFAPFINTLNFMGGTSVGPKMTFADGLSIFGKYYISDDMAVRAKFAFNHFSDTRNNFVIDQTVIEGTEDDVIEDEANFNYSRYALAVGVEMRRGNGRLQGYYGADLFFEYKSGGSGLNNMNYTVDYANAYGTDHINPVSTDFINDFEGNVGTRILEVQNGSAMGVGLRGFIGVEYFIAPKISLGGELGWGLAYQMGSDGETVTEEWDALNGKVNEITEKNGGQDDQFIIGTTGSSNGFFEQNQWLGLTGNINIIFHF